MTRTRLAALCMVALTAIVLIGDSKMPEKNLPKPPASVDSEEEYLEWAFEQRPLADPPAPTPAELTVDLPVKSNFPLGPIELVQKLMAQHPKPSVQDLYAASRTGAVGIHFEQSNSPIGATFSLMHAGHIQSRPMHTLHGRQVNGLVPTLSVNITWLPTDYTAMNIVDMMLRIYHETWHWLQFKRAKPKVRELFNLSSDSSMYGRDACESWLSLELEAYGATCAVAEEWGALGETENSSCRYANRQDRNYFLFRNIIRGKSLDSTRACQRTWAEMVGHPYPELFPYQAIR